MKGNSFILGLVGLFMILFGGLVGVYASAVSLISGIFLFFGIDASFILGLGLVSAVLGLILGLVGLWIVVNNENKILKLFLGIVGIVLGIIGAILIFSTAVGNIPGLFGGLLLVAFGLAFIGYGFNIDALKPLSKLIDNYKRMF